MTFRLIERGWQKEIYRGLSDSKSAVSIACPFIKLPVINGILERAEPKSMRVLTRFNLNDFSAGVSDIASLQSLLRRGALVRGTKNLHAKLYIFGGRRALVTSANLTYSGLSKNHEFGCISDDPSVVASCQTYFDQRWAKGKPLTSSQLDKWQAEITKRHLVSNGARQLPPLPDYGADEDQSEDAPLVPIRISDADRVFVKFFGTTAGRTDRSASTLAEVVSSNSNSVLSYPLGKRPRQIKDGDLVYIGRLVRDPDDLMIYGRAFGMRHVEGRDDASPADIKKRDWRKIWPHYVRVYDPEFVRGVLDNAVSLNELMGTLGYKSFASTLRNFEAGTGNTNPRHAYQQQAQVELSPYGAAWLNERLTKAFQEFGTLAPADLSAIV